MSAVLRVPRLCYRRGPSPFRFCPDKGRKTLGSCRAPARTRTSRPWSRCTGRTAGSGSGFGTKGKSKGKGQQQTSAVKPKPVPAANPEAKSGATPTARDKGTPAHIEPPSIWESLLLRAAGPRTLSRLRFLPKGHEPTLQFV